MVSIEQQSRAREHSSDEPDDESFYETNKEDLRQLFALAGHEQEWSEDPTDQMFVDYIRRGWIGKEHGDKEGKDVFSDEQIDAMLPHLENLGITGEVLPDPDSSYESTIVLGATSTAVKRRDEVLTKVIEEGVDVGNVYYLLGERPRMDRDGTDEELLSTEGRLGGHDISENPWVTNRVRGAMEGTARPLTETDLGRIVISKALNGNMAPYRIDVPIVSINGVDTGIGQKLPGADLPHRELLDQHFVTDDGLSRVIVNGDAVSRGADKAPRPTTSSTVEEWLDRYPPAESASVLVVSSNPHGDRQLRAVREVLERMGRSDIHVELAATSPPANYTKEQLINVGLGEAGRMIDQDNKRASSNS